MASEDLLEDIRILEIEKSKIKSNMGGGNSTQINENYDAFLVWETLAIVKSNIMTFARHIGQ